MVRHDHRHRAQAQRRVDDRSQLRVTAAGLGGGARIGEEAEVEDGDELQQVYESLMPLVRSEPSAT